MTSGDRDNLFYCTLGKKLLRGKVGQWPGDQFPRLCRLQEADLQYPGIDEIARPVFPYLPKGMDSAKEQGDLRTVLHHTAEPVKQQVKIEIVCFSGFF